MNYKRIIVVKKQIVKQMTFLFAVLFVFLSQSCGVYSFTPAKMDADLKTITIQNFVMNTAGGPANMPLNLTEKLKEYYQRNTSLKLKAANGDLFLEGTIIGYEISPVANTASDKAAMNRLTITLNVHFVNSKDENQSFEKEFSFYQDFNQEQTISQVENSLVPKILDQLILNIFNDTAAQW